MAGFVRIRQIESRPNLCFGRTLRLSSDRHDLIPPPLPTIMKKTLHILTILLLPLTVFGQSDYWARLSISGGVSERRLILVIYAIFAEKISFAENKQYICRIICGE